MLTGFHISLLLDCLWNTILFWYTVCISSQLGLATFEGDQYLWLVAILDQVALNLVSCLCVCVCVAVTQSFPSPQVLALKSQELVSTCVFKCAWQLELIGFFFFFFSWEGVVLYVQNFVNTIVLILHFLQCLTAKQIEVLKGFVSLQSDVTFSVNPTVD